MFQVPPADNYFAALNSAVFSDGSFVYIPKGVRCPMEVSTYFRINASETGQVQLPTCCFRRVRSNTSAGSHAESFCQQMAGAACTFGTLLGWAVVCLSSPFGHGPLASAMCCWSAELALLPAPLDASSGPVNFLC